MGSQGSWRLPEKGGGGDTGLASFGFSWRAGNGEKMQLHREDAGTTIELIK